MEKEKLICKKSDSFVIILKKLIINKIGECIENH